MKPTRPQYHGDLKGDDTLARRTARATLVTRVFILVAIAVGLAVLYTMISLSSDTNQIINKVSDKQNSNAPLLASIQSLARQINSCTNPEGDCAKRGQARTAEAIGSIKGDTRDVVVATIVCQQQGVTGFNRIALCVDRSLAAHPRKH